MPTSAEGLELGYLGWKSSHSGNSAKGVSDYNGTKIAMGDAPLIAGTSGTFKKSFLLFSEDIFPFTGMPFKLL